MQRQLSRADSAVSIASNQPTDTPRSSFSSFGTRVPSISRRDAALYSLAQGLVPVINDPSVQSHLNPAWCWPFGGNSDSFTTPPPLSHGIVYEVTLQDFRRYMRVMADKYNRFEANLANIAPEHQALSTPDSETGEMLHSQGDGLAQAMRQVPPQYFTEDFTLSRPETWQEVFPSELEDDRQDTLEQLSSYLDAVEIHLLRDIAARSENFFQAASVVQDLRGVLARTYTQVKALRKQLLGLLGEDAAKFVQIHLLNEEVLEAAVTVQRLLRRRANLKDLNHKLQVVDHVAQSQYALQLLLPQGDYAAALDIITDIQATVEREAVQQLHCFRQLPHQLSEASEAVRQLMAADLLGLLRFHALPHFKNHIVAAITQQQEYLASGQPTERGEYRLQSEDGSLAVPESEAAGASAAFSNGGAGELPVGRVLSLGRAALHSMQPDTADNDELTQLITPLVLGLKRMDGVSAVLRSYKEAMAAEVKQGIRDVVEQALPVVLGQQWSRLQHQSLADKLQAVSSEGFLWLLAAVLCVSEACLQQCKRVRGLLEEGLKGGRMPRTQWAPLLQGMQEAAQAVSEVSHGRFAKLLASRAKANNEMQVNELKQMLQLCGEFSSMAEGLGCRPVASLRTAAQLQCKSYLDALHHHTFTNLTGALEQESWSAAPVPPDSQQLVQDWAQRAAQVKAGGASSLANGDQSPPESQGHLDGAGRQGQPSNSPPASTSGRPSNPSGPRTIPPRSPSRREEEVLRVGGQQYHVAHTVLLLLRMLQGYMTFQGAVPLLAPETARRAVDLLKVFNSRMCQLVLGAGAMQVSGLRSITAKHLALSSQCLSACMALHPLLKPLLTATLPTPRLGLILPEFDRLLQDLSMHKEEIHSKLVAIMRERLATNLKQLPLIATTWAGSPPAPGSPPPPSNFAQTNAKQLRILSQVLSPILLPADLHSIFGRVAALFSKSLTDAFSRLEPRGMAWEAQCGEDLRHLLHTLQRLPMDPGQAASNVGPLVNLCNTRFAALPSQPSPVTCLSPGEAHVRRLHRSLTENDATAQKQGHLSSGRGQQQQQQQQQSAEPDRATAGSYAQKIEQAGPTLLVGGDTEAKQLLQHEQDAGTHGASQQPCEADPVLSASDGDAHPSTSSQSATGGLNESLNGSGVPEGQSSTWDGSATPDSGSGQASQEAQHAGVAMEEAGDEEIGTADDGENDLVATSSSVLADPKVLSELTNSKTGLRTASSEAVSFEHAAA